MLSSGYFQLDTPIISECLLLPLLDITQFIGIVTALFTEVSNNEILSDKEISVSVSIVKFLSPDNHAEISDSDLFIFEANSF